MRLRRKPSVLAWGSLGFVLLSVLLVSPAFSQETNIIDGQQLPNEYPKDRSQEQNSLRWKLPRNKEGTSTTPDNYLTSNPKLIEVSQFAHLFGFTSKRTVGSTSSTNLSSSVTESKYEPTQQNGDNITNLDDEKGRHFVTLSKSFPLSTFSEDSEVSVRSVNDNINATNSNASQNFTEIVFSKDFLNTTSHKLTEVNLSSKNPDKSLAQYARTNLMSTNNVRTTSNYLHYKKGNERYVNKAFTKGFPSLFYNVSNVNDIHNDGGMPFTNHSKGITDAGNSRTSLPKLVLKNLFTSSVFVQENQQLNRTSKTFNSEKRILDSSFNISRFTDRSGDIENMNRLSEITDQYNQGNNTPTLGPPPVTRMLSSKNETSSLLDISGNDKNLTFNTRSKQADNKRKWPRGKSNVTGLGNGNRGQRNKSESRKKGSKRSTLISSSSLENDSFSNTAFTQMLTPNASSNFSQEDFEARNTTLHFSKEQATSNKDFENNHEVKIKINLDMTNESMNDGNPIIDTLTVSQDSKNDSSSSTTVVSSELSTTPSDTILTIRPTMFENTKTTSQATSISSIAATTETPTEVTSVTTYSQTNLRTVLHDTANSLDIVNASSSTTNDSTSVESQSTANTTIVVTKGESTSVTSSLSSDSSSVPSFPSSILPSSDSSSVPSFPSSILPSSDSSGVPLFSSSMLPSSDSSGVPSFSSSMLSSSDSSVSSFQSTLTKREASASDSTLKTDSITESGSTTDTESTTEKICTPLDYNVSVVSITSFSATIEVKVSDISDCIPKENITLCLNLTEAHHGENCKTFNTPNNCTFEFLELESCSNYTVFLDGNNVKELITSLGKPVVDSFDLSVPYALNLTIDLTIKPQTFMCRGEIKYYSIGWTEVDDTERMNENLENCTHPSSCNIVVEKYYQDYNVCVSAINIPEYNNSLILEGDTKCDTIKSKAGNATAPGISGQTTKTSVNVSLYPPDFPNGNISYYQYKNSFDGGYWNITTQPYFVIENLRSCQTIDVTVRAVDNVTEEFSIFGHQNTTSFTTQAEVPGPVSDFEVHPTNSSLILNWNKTSDFLCNITSYTFKAIPKNNNVNNIIEQNETDGLLTNWTLEGVHPFTEYEVKVLASTSAGPGESSSQIVNTSIAAPKTPQRPEITSCTVNSCHVMWTVDNQLTGPTNFTIIFTSSKKGSSPVLCWTDVYYELTDNPVGINCINLEAYTKYTATVTANVDQFEPSQSDVSEPKQTCPTVPKSPESINMICDLSPLKIDLIWEFNQTNGQLEYFEIEYNRSRYGASELFKSVQNMKCDFTQYQCPCQSSLDVDAEYNYTIVVKVKNKDVEEKNSSAPLLCNKKARAPVKPDKSQWEDFLTSVSKSNNIVTFELSKKLFSSRMGEIRNFDIILYQKDVQFDKNTTILSWQNVYNAEKILPYRVNPENWNPFIASMKQFRDMCCENMSDVKVKCEIGCDQGCSPSSGEFCNGPLRRDTYYKLVVRAYTIAGFMDTEAVEFTTETGYQKSKVQITVAICLTFLVLFFVSVVFLYYRRKDIKSLLQFCPPKSTDLDDSITPDINIVNRSNARPVSLEEFAKHYQTMKSDSALRFSQEFEELKSISPSHAMTAAQLPENRSKNRWINILPFDHSRVKLLPMTDEDSSDYINACYIPGYNCQREFIATQGPLAATKDDFWRMVWEQSCQMIIMLTQCVEKGKNKCEQYWPVDNEVHYYGDLAVQMRSETVLNSYTLRVFDMHMGTKSLEVKQLHFTQWPDFGCPEHTHDLINFVRSVRDQMILNASSTIIIHCSAGVGRTGTFIAVDRLMQHIRYHPTVDVYGTVLEMRNFRMYMVQTEDQYIYIHSCVKDMLESVQTVVPAYENIYENLPSAFNQDSQL